MRESPVGPALAVTNGDSVSYVRLCGDRETAKHLLQKNIFVKGVAGTMFGFENKVLESAIKQDMEQQPELWSSWQS